MLSKTALRGRNLQSILPVMSTAPRRFVKVSATLEKKIPESSNRAPSVLPQALRIANLRKAYGSVEVLHGVDLEVDVGERVALMGRSGSGKSTLLNCICGIEPFNAGEIQVGGEALSTMDAVRLEQMRRERIGYVFQSFHLLPTLTALENVEFPGQLIHLQVKQRRQRAKELLRLVGMEHREDHRPDALSGGERQRVALARAVMNRPRLILADEPTGSLDSASGDQVLDLIEQVSIDEGIAVLLVTHDRSTARICDRVVRMQDGQILGESE
ncbi:MAG: ABC transporter ATP-binding protein [Coraliomargarita sp.]